MARRHDGHARRPAAGEDDGRKGEGARIEPSETKRLRPTTMRKTAGWQDRGGQAIAAKAPSAVATPLPPRKPIENGKTMAEDGEKAAQRREDRDRGKFQRPGTPGRKPLRMSNTATGRAAFQPLTRRTLVAPGAPLPNSRMSFFPQILTRR